MPLSIILLLDVIDINVSKHCPVVVLANRVSLSRAVLLQMLSLVEYKRWNNVRVAFLMFSTITIILLPQKQVNSSELIKRQDTLAMATVAL